MAKLGLCKREGNSRVGRWQAYRFSYPERLKSRSLHGCPSNHQALLVLLCISICLFLPSRKSWWRVCCHVNCLVSIQRSFVYGGFILSSIRFQRFFLEQLNGVPIGVSLFFFFSWSWGKPYSISIKFFFDSIQLSMVTFTMYIYISYN